MADPSGHYHLILLYKPLYSVSPQLKGLCHLKPSQQMHSTYTAAEPDAIKIYSASQSHQARSCLNIVLRLLFKVTALYDMTARLRWPPAIEPPAQTQSVYKVVQIPRTCLLVTAVKTQSMAQHGCCTASCIVLHLLIVLNLWRQVVAACSGTHIIQNCTSQCH